MTSPSLLIIGLGKTGLSCARFLARQNLPFKVIDTRSEPPELAQFRMQFPNTPLHLGSFNQEWLQQAKQIILSPGIALHQPAIAEALNRGTEVIGDIELFARTAKAPIIGITGTNAKGTVTTLVGDMIKQAGLKVAVGGNIGTPALDLLTQPSPDFYVLEISSFQLETTYHLSTIAATILNLSPDHLDRHGTMTAYQAAKQRIYQQCVNAVYNRDDLATYPQNPVQRLINFGLSEPATGEFGIRQQHLAYGDELLLPVKSLRIQGTHNWANALAALALGHSIRLPMPAMLKTLQEFPGLPHRCQWLAKQNDVDWYNDSKGTNVGSTLAALEGLGKTLSGKIVLIAGGVGKNADFSLLQPAVANYVRALILIGQDGPRLAQALAETVPAVFADSLEDAISKAQQEAQAGDAILLSPACASFDMFRDFADRGEKFSAAVKEFLAERQY